MQSGVNKSLLIRFSSNSKIFTTNLHAQYKIILISRQIIFSSKVFIGQLYPFYIKQSVSLITLKDTGYFRSEQLFETALTGFRRYSTMAVIHYKAISLSRAPIGILFIVLRFLYMIYIIWEKRFSESFQE